MTIAGLMLGLIDHLGLFDAKTGLFKLINHTTTSMGARQLRQFLRYPLINPADIAHRHAQIETLHNHHTSPEWSELTHQINDIERVLGRICSKFQNPKMHWHWPNHWGMLPMSCNTYSR